MYPLKSVRFDQGIPEAPDAHRKKNLLVLFRFPLQIYAHKRSHDKYGGSYSRGCDGSDRFYLLARHLGDQRVGEGGNLLRKSGDIAVLGRVTGSVEVRERCWRRLSLMALDR